MKNQQPPDGEDAAALHLEEAREGRWTWRYVDPASGMTLHSNETFSSREAAVDWARRAYPDVPFAEEHTDQPS